MERVPHPITVLFRDKWTRIDSLRVLYARIITAICIIIVTIVIITIIIFTFFCDIRQCPLWYFQQLRAYVHATLLYAGQGSDSIGSLADSLGRSSAVYTVHFVREVAPG